VYLSSPRSTFTITGGIAGGIDGTAAIGGMPARTKSFSISPFDFCVATTYPTPPHTNPIKRMVYGLCVIFIL
jgi:hypothetical protein